MYIVCQALMTAHQKKNAILMKKLMTMEGLTQTQMDAMDTTEVSAHLWIMWLRKFSDTTVNFLQRLIVLLKLLF